MLTAIAVVNLSCQSQKPAARAASIEDRVYRWLEAQPGPTGLLGNQENDDFSGIYPNALAAICFLHRVDMKRAERIFAFYQSHFEREFAAGSPGGFHQFWNAKTGDVFADTDRWVGDNAWLLIALNQHRKVTGSDRFSTTRRGIAEWLISLQDKDGGIWSGFTKNGPMGHKSTEANLDCYAALVDYPGPRERVRQWLMAQMWIAAEHRFKMGTTAAETPLDSVSWGIASLGPDMAGALTYAERTFVRLDISDANGRAIAGFADFVGRQRVWLEGTGQMVVAYRVAGKPALAEKVLAELEQVMIPSSSVPGAVGLPCSTSDPAWDGATKKIFVPSQAWYLLGKWGLNPMADTNEAKP